MSRLKLSKCGATVANIAVERKGFDLEHFLTLFDAGMNLVITGVSPPGILQEELPLCDLGYLASQIKWSE